MLPTGECIPSEEPVPGMNGFLMCHFSYNGKTWTYESEIPNNLAGSRPEEVAKRPAQHSTKGATARSKRPAQHSTKDATAGSNMPAQHGTKSLSKKEYSKMYHAARSKAL
eukprot:1393501-Lingulodinium_polyedra.AAC.1